MRILVAALCLRAAFAWVTTTVGVPYHHSINHHHPAFSSSALSVAAIDASSSTTTADVVDNADVVVLNGQVKTHSHCQEVGDRDILVRAARGEITERTPIWLMRQAGRYMAAFRQYSDRLPFRQRSETADYAVELSLQCHRAYGMDGIIMFSDILTPLPCLSIDFDVVKGTGPVISTVVATEADVARLRRVPNFDDTVPFVREILTRLKQEAVEANTALIGFVGAPFTLAAYTIEGKSSKNCERTNKLLLQDMAGTNRAVSLFLDQLVDLIADYAIYQIDAGAEVIQLFESWAHQLTPQNFAAYAKPAANRVIERIKAARPHVPVIYFANGGSSYLELQKDMPCDMIAVDQHVDMMQARRILGPDTPISGNIDPSILKFGTKEQIENAVRDCIDRAGGPGNRHVLNLGHGVMQGTPEENVKYLVDACKNYKRISLDEQPQQ
jgi:uroporphyrinogen decarboxylase